MTDHEKSTAARAWTAPQLAAITHVRGDLLVSAAAGSGKTAVLAERCARLIGQEGAEAGAPRTGIDNLLVLTFTDAAAGEMRSRIAAALDARLHAAPAPAPQTQRWLRRQVAMVDRASISTLHAFCMRLLRQHFHEAQVDPAFEIMDQEEAQLLQDEVLEGLMARWHALPAAGTVAADGLTAAAFTEFYEGYAQGRESECRRLVLELHRMLASTAFPQKYIAAARGLYGAGAEQTFAAFEREMLAGRIRLTRLKAQRAWDEVRGLAGAEKMAAGLAQALAALEDAAEMLRAQGASAWGTIQGRLAYKWPVLRRPESIADFDALKARTWDALKEAMAGLAALFEPEPARMLQDLRQLAVPLETLLALTVEFEQAFTAAKRADNRLDFADLERLAFDLLTGPHSLAAAELRQRYHHLLVDEFQDINPLQAELLHALRNPRAGGGRGNLFVVGDIKQSIYAFRLAQPELFLRRQRDARAAQAGSPAHLAYVALQHNFRSQPGLLAVMNGLFERILTPAVTGIDYAQGHEFQPPPDAGKQGGESSPPPAAAFTGTPVEVHLVAMDSADGGDEDAGAAEPLDDRQRDDDALRPDGAAPPERLDAVEQEAQMVAERIAGLLAQGRMVREKGGLVPLRPRHIAILLRTMKGKAMLFARALADRGIAVHADLSAGFFEAAEVKDTLALLQVLDNPRQDIPLATVLLGPYGQFSHDDLARIRLAFDRREVAFAEAAARYAEAARDEDPGLPSGDRALKARELAARLTAFFETLARWREWLRARPLHEGLAEIYTESKILAYAAGLDTGAQRVANLQFLHQRALKFSTFKKQGLHRFLRFIAKLREQENAGFAGGRGGDIGEAPVLSEASDVVRILSVHKSKGLEFPVVFVSGLGGKMRLTAQGPVLLHRDMGAGLYVTDVERNIAYPSAAALRIAEEQRRALRAEELRLLYVALTRARECVILTGHVGKSAEIDKWREAWRDWRGPLPEDALLAGRRALDWLMPALAAGREVNGDGQAADTNDAPVRDDAASAEDAEGAGMPDRRLTICWDGPPGAARGAQVVITTHEPRPQAAGAAASGDAVAPLMARIMAGAPLNAAGADDPRVERMIRRVTGKYAFAAQSQQPAVQTVTFLKSAESQREDAGEVAAAAEDLAGLEAWDGAAGPAAESAAPADPAAADPAAAGAAQAIEAARLRGVATHRVLELLDLARCDSQAALDGQRAALLAAKLLTQKDAQRADWAGIGWFLWQSATGARVMAAARRIAGGDADLRLRREIGFAWLAPADGGEPPEGGTTNLGPKDGTANLVPPKGGATNVEDLPTVRGVIDLLLVDVARREAEIVDYKTDSAPWWESRAEAYRRQMGYYLAAASEILGFEVGRATLVFLAARREVVVGRH